eukprot:1837216-Prymnesium_polylepis.1
MPGGSLVAPRASSTWKRLSTTRRRTMPKLSPSALREFEAATAFTVVSAQVSPEPDPRAPSCARARALRGSRAPPEKQPVIWGVHCWRSAHSA